MTGPRARRVARVIDLIHQIESAMDEICLIAEKDPRVDDLICARYPFEGSLDEVSMRVNEWRFAITPDDSHLFDERQAFVDAQHDKEDL